MKHFRVAFLATAFAAGAFQVQAQDEATPLEGVVVTATRTETTITDLPVPVIVIDRATIERNAGATLPDLLRLAAGLEVAQSGGPGQLATVFIRGTESDHVLVLVDGVELSPGTIGTLQLQNIDPAIIERIEVVKGPRSALYGSEAIGGVINIITRRDADAVRVHTGAGSFGTWQLGAGTSIGGGETHFEVDLAHRESEGIAPRAASEIERGYDNSSANLRLATALGPLGLMLRHYRSEGTTEYLDFLLAPSSQDFENSVSEIRFDWRLNAWRSQLSVSDAQDLLSQVGAGTFSDTGRRVLDWQNDFVTGNHVFTVGAYAENEEVVAENFGRTDADTNVRALYLQEQWHGKSVDLASAVRGTDHERFGNELSWNVDAGWQIAESWKLRANAGRAFRAPNATFLFGPFGANPDLEPEIAVNGELALTWQANAAQQFTFAVYHNRIDDMIDFDPVTSTYANIARVRIRGAEIGHRWQADGWQGHANVTLQEPENALTHEPLLRRAEEIATIGVARDLGGIDLGFDILASGERADIDADTFAPVTGAGYVLLNFTANWFIDRRWSLAGRIENALDADYQTAAGYNTAGRGIFVTLRYNH